MPKYNQLNLEQKGDTLKVTAELSPVMYEIFEGNPLFLGIDMMQGDQVDLPDGFTRYTFTVDDPGKIKMLFEFATMVFSYESLTNKN